MITLAPSRSLVGADLLKLRKRRALVVVTALLTVVATTVTYSILALLHLASPNTHGPAGGIMKLGHGAFLASAFGAIAAIIVAATLGAGDLEAGVYRDLVVSGRSRLRLYAARYGGGLLFVLPFAMVAYALTAVAAVVFHGNLRAPSTELLVTTGLWVLLSVVFYYLFALGFTCLVGSRSYAIGVVLAWMLALSPILMSIHTLGVGRELVPGSGLQHLAPSALGDTVRQGSPVPMSVAATAVVLLVWVAVAVFAGAWRDTTREA